MDAETSSCPISLIAQTVGLMTSFAAVGGPANAASGAQQAMAHAIVWRLELLGQHPQLPHPLQLSMRQAHGHWVTLLQSLAEPAAEAPRPWVH